MIERASNERLLEFANAVREAGGANPLDALMPAVPQDGYGCLVAQAMNFNCCVGGSSDKGIEEADSNRSWSMFIEDRDAVQIAERIQAKTGLAWLPGHEDEDYEAEILLPPDIRQVAEDFDKLWDIMQRPGTRMPAGRTIESYASLYPLIDESMRENVKLSAARRKALQGS